MDVTLADGEIFSVTGKVAEVLLAYIGENLIAPSGLKDLPEEQA
jgi:hypothetical protein